MCLNKINIMKILIILAVLFSICNIQGTPDDTLTSDTVWSYEYPIINRGLRSIYHVTVTEEKKQSEQAINKLDIILQKLDSLELDRIEKQRLTKLYN